MDSIPITFRFADIDPGMIREENAATRDVLLTNMCLLAGRNPVDGSK